MSVETSSVDTLVKTLKERPTLSWGVTELLPEQGEWSGEDYLWLTRSTRRLVEYSDGYVEVLPTPTDQHQVILAYLYRALFALVHPLGGIVLFAALRIRLGTRTFREPDLVVLQRSDDPRRGNDFWTGADLVVEIVSPDDPERDLVTKRAEYAEASIPEYWIVYPAQETITVLRLQSHQYIEHGVYRRAETAVSALLDGFGVSVDEVLDAK
jgi:Uma2 family endonuclease